MQDHFTENLEEMNSPAVSYGVSTTSDQYLPRSKLLGIRPEKRLKIET